ncbi:hypothetical protein SAMN05216490_4916 [Mucilaginibacter mallensis]|uniref:Uncharacterized protein n=1 Tax=Mucilaginibacter mallensis TaxID=652787 RepID=A0A1H2CEH3_MUCMA|nr:hypothetical protein SAMN05216490_4916 [Mucilaginibacter mallensis]
MNWWDRKWNYSLNCRSKAQMIANSDQSLPVITNILRKVLSKPCFLIKKISILFVLVEQAWMLSTILFDKLNHIFADRLICLY